MPIKSHRISWTRDAKDVNAINDRLVYQFQRLDEMLQVLFDTTVTQQASIDALTARVVTLEGFH